MENIQFPTNYTREELRDLFLNVIPEGIDPITVINGLLYAIATIITVYVNLNKTPEGLFSNMLECYLGLCADEKPTIK